MKRNFNNKLVALVLLSFGMLASCGVKAQAISVDPALEGIMYSSLETIPEGPYQDLKGTACEYFDFYVEPNQIEFQPAVKISEQGWKVLSVSSYANYTLVAFSGSLTAGTSATCFISQGNIAIFDDTQLLGVLYSVSPDYPFVGSLKLMDGGFVRVFSGDYIQVPIADMQVTLDGLALKPTSDLTAYCNGQSMVPNVIGQNIAIARSLLMEFGFKPEVYEDTSILGWRENLIDAGITEVEACSGTGFAFCRFNYENRASYVSLISAGEEEFPTVVRSIVECKQLDG